MDIGNEMLTIFLQFLKAFAVGGGICLIAQIIINFTDLTAGKILVYFMLAGVVPLYSPFLSTLTMRMLRLWSLY